MTATRQIPWLRVCVEGVVIVGSILLAFGIDAWWNMKATRRRLGLGAAPTMLCSHALRLSVVVILAACGDSPNEPADGDDGEEIRSLGRRSRLG